MKKPSSVLIGAAGEHYVLFELYRRGILAGQPPQGVANVDLVVLDEEANVVTNLQVKTRTYGSDGGWHMKAKHEDLASDRLFYVFVDLEPDSPRCYVIPSQIVADHCTRSHSTWLSLPGRNGHVRKDSAMRRVVPKVSWGEVPGFPDGWMDQYLDAWHLLEADSHTHGPK